MNAPTLPPESAPDEEQSFGTPVDLGRLLSAVWSARLWIVLAFLVGAGAGIGAAKMFMPHSYRAQAVLRYDGMSNLPGIPLPDETALGELESAFVARPVLTVVGKKLGIDLPLKLLRAKVSTSSSQQSDTVAVAFEDDTDEKALKGLEAVIDEAREHREDLRRATIRQTLDRTIARAEKQEREVEGIRERYKAFRKEHGIADLSAERQEGLRGAASLQAQRDMTEAEVKALEAQVRQLESQVARAPTMEVASSAVSNPDAERLANLEAQLAEARSSLSGEHPRVRSLELQVSNLQRRVSSGESKSVSHSTMTRSSTLSSAKADLTSARGRLLAAKEQFASLSALAEEASSKVKRYGEIEGQAVSFMSQLEVAERLLDEMRAAKAQLSAALHAPESGFTVIDPPTKPEKPEPNKARKKLAVVVPLGLVLLVILQALVREFWGARIVTSTELGFWGRGPVLAASTWPRDETAFEELVADFDDCAPGALGETLMVAGTQGVLEATDELARRLHVEWFENAVVVGASVPSQLPRTRALASGDQPRGGQSKTIELWRSPPENEATTDTAHGGFGASGVGASTPRVTVGRVVAWSGGMEGHGLRRAARLADRVVVVVEAGALSPMSLRKVRAAIARDSHVGFILVSAPETVIQGQDRVGPVREFWSTASA